jgi:hypothetical protein
MISHLPATHDPIDPMFSYRKIAHRKRFNIKRRGGGGGGGGLDRYSTLASLVCLLVAAGWLVTVCQLRLVWLVWLAGYWLVGLFQEVGGTATHQISVLVLRAGYFAMN